MFKVMFAQIVSVKPVENLETTQPVQIQNVFLIYAHHLIIYPIM